jgi:hypothetical protein
MMKKPMPPASRTTSNMPCSFGRLPRLSSQPVASLASLIGESACSRISRRSDIRNRGGRGSNCIKTAYKSTPGRRGAIAAGPQREALVELPNFCCDNRKGSRCCLKPHALSHLGGSAFGQQRQASPNTLIDGPRRDACPSPPSLQGAAHPWPPINEPTATSGPARPAMSVVRTRGSRQFGNHGRSDEAHGLIWVSTGVEIGASIEMAIGSARAVNAALQQVRANRATGPSRAARS